MLREVCKRAVRCIDWGKVFSEGWGEEDGEREWEKWNETYGQLLILAVFLWNQQLNLFLFHRTRRRNR